MRSDTPSPIRRFRFAIAMTVLGALVGFIHNRFTDKNGVDPVSATVRTIVSPFAYAFGGVTRWVSGSTSWIFNARRLSRENIVLKQQVAELQAESLRAQESNSKYERLRQDLGFVHTHVNPPLAADVVARRPDPKFDTLVLSRGSRDGIKVNSVVSTRNGLVGRVFEVTPTTCSVLLITDQNSGVGASVQRPESRAAGVIKGDNSALLQMVYLAQNADIKPGDAVVTSGLGGIYPAGLPVGIVKDVRVDAANSLKVARITPHVDTDSLEEVYVSP